MKFEMDKVVKKSEELVKKGEGLAKDMLPKVKDATSDLKESLSTIMDKGVQGAQNFFEKKDDVKEVLDVATGTGDLAIAIQKGTGAKVVGLDLSQQMLNVGAVKIKKLNLDGRISLQKGDAEQLPFEDNRFDAVSVAFGVRNFENLNKGLAELRRVVKKEKSVYILEFSKVEGLLAPLYMFYFKNILPMIGRLVSKDNRAYTYLPDSVNAFPFGEKMKQILLETGFKKVEYKKLSLGIATIYKATK